MLDFPRSTIYAQQKRESTRVVFLHPMRRGPKPKIADADLLLAIRNDLDASPFIGEGHRKVWRGCASCEASVSPAPVCCV